MRINFFFQKNQFSEGCSWFKINSLGLALDMTLKSYNSVAKGLKLKVRKFLGLIPPFVVEVTREKLVGYRVKTRVEFNLG